ncbi:thiolase family protein [Bacillus sp. FSL W8-0223]|uniref:thiolase family protein n=1 Tax=Bacillus sp. FSL W8-0223 TaxID=2954595 RepID=UPI0030FCDE80
MPRAVIVAAKRSAVGKIGGIFRNVLPEVLAAKVIQAVLEECPIPAEEIDDVILGNVVGPGGNLARLSALTAGLPVEIPGMTIDRQCGSGLEAIITACRFVQAGAGNIYIAGGVESTSLAPWKIEKPASLYSAAAPRIYTRARFSPDWIGDPEMGIAAENVARVYHVSREEQDEYALRSHQKAVKAQENQLFAEEIVPINNKSQDECPRPGLTLSLLRALKPVFQEDGMVTAGNACPINDGAAIVLVMSLEKCRELNLEPVMEFVDSAVAGVDPNLLGIGPVPAVKRLLHRTGISLQDIDLVEFNEAFASQVIASIRELGLPEEKVNIHGGALAIGHPYGASGAIIVTRLFHEIKRDFGETGLATLGIGGGIGLSALFQRFRS